MARRGRIDEVKHARWRRLLRKFRASGLRARAFCDRNDIPESQFWWWKRRLDEQIEAAGAGNAPTFVPVTMLEESRKADAAIDIRLTSGQRLRVRSGCDRQLLAEVIDLLEGRSC